jgi:DNA-directed RNA polymerase specialized sigma24 family protein
VTASDHHPDESRQQAGTDPEAAMAAILLRHKDLLVDFLFQMTGSQDRAIEFGLRTAVMLGRPKNLEVVRSDPRPWLVKEATRRVLRLERGQRVRRLFFPHKHLRPGRPVFEEGVTPGGGVPAWERMEEERVLREALGAITPKLRRLLVLRDIMGLATDDVARLTGLSLQQIQARLERGRAEFAAALAGAREE